MLRFAGVLAILSLGGCLLDRAIPQPSGGGGSGADATGGGGSGATGGGATGGTGGDPTGGTGGGSTGGTGGTGGAMPVCGDGAVQAGEECEPPGSSVTCGDQHAGMATCTAACKLDTSGCEDCFNGVDDDGDGAVDCKQAGCNTLCVNGTSCADPIGPFHQATNFAGDTGLGTTTQTPRCSFGSTNNLFYELSPQTSGVLVVGVRTAAPSQLDAILSVEKPCSDDDTKTLICADDYATGGELVWAPVTANQSVWIVVDGYAASGAFTLDAFVTPTVLEGEPNDETDGAGAADGYAYGYTGSVGPGDNDVVAYSVPSNGTLIARLVPFDGTDSCAGAVLAGFTGFGASLTGFTVPQTLIGSSCDQVTMAVTAGQTLWFKVTGTSGVDKKYGLAINVQ